MEELGELASSIAKGKDIKDDIGDIIVTLIMVAEIKGTSITESLLHAYNDIKDRRGYLNKDGIFIKESDYDSKKIT